MRFRISIWLVALVLLGGTGLVLARFALATAQVAAAREQAEVAVQAAAGQLAPVQPVAVQSQPIASDPRQTSTVPVLGELPIVGRLFAIPSTGDHHDDRLSELVQLDANLAQQSQQLIDQYSEAKDEVDRVKLKAQLAQTLERQFDSQQQLRELEVSRIEGRLKTLRELIAKRNDSKRSIIDKRLDQLIGDAEGLGWSSPGVGVGPVKHYPIPKQ